MASSSSSCARQLSRLARGLARLRAEGASSGALPSASRASRFSTVVPPASPSSVAWRRAAASSFPFASSPLVASSLPSSPLARGFHATAGVAMGARDAKSMKIVPEGKKLRPRPRGIEPPETPWAAGKRNDPNFGRGGGGMSPFTPTAQLRKRKTYQKRCAYIMQTLEHEKMSEIAAGSAVPAFRPGDVLRVKVEVLENRRRANWFTGICIARRNRGMGSSFTLRSVMANVPVERTFPLYSPTIKEMEIVERRKVRRAKLYYLRDKPLRYSRV
jgi:large subunit ribosomal protein L19